MDRYISSKKSRKKILHKSGCFMSCRITESNRLYFDSLQEGQDRGYHLCKYCYTTPKHYIVVDLEMSEVSKANRSLCKKMWGEIIQIGAVVLDSNFQETGHFNTLVKPQYNTKITKTYEKLTGIKTQMVQDAPEFSQALKMFLKWCSSIPGNIEILQWSNSDLIQIEREMTFKKYQPSSWEKKYLKNWTDFQQEFGQTIERKGCISLKDAIYYAGIEIAGRRHDALFDARNTGKLVATLRDKELAEIFEEKVAKVMRTNHFGTSLAGLLAAYPLSSKVS